MEITDNVSVIAGMLVVMAFCVNIIVQLTKEIVTLPTKLWCVIVSVSVNLSALCIGSGFGIIYIAIETVLSALLSSFMVAYVAMYGFDTFRELWTRFKRGEDIYEDN